MLIRPPKIVPTQLEDEQIFLNPEDPAVDPSVLLTIESAANAKDAVVTNNVTLVQKRVTDRSARMRNELRATCVREEESTSPHVDT